MDEQRYLTRQGEVVWGQQNVSIQYDAQAQAWYAIEIVTDLTGKKKMRTDLQSALAELKERNFELDQFVYRTSHDLRSPLTTIVGPINVIKPKPIPQEIQHGRYMPPSRAVFSRKTFALERVTFLDEGFQVLVDGDVLALVVPGPPKE